MYKNKVIHHHYGEVWYNVELRNWNGMFSSREENLAMGPCFELSAKSAYDNRLDYGLVTGGATLEEAIEKLLNLLDLCAARGMVLVSSDKKVMSWWQQWRLKRLLKRTCNPV